MLLLTLRGTPTIYYGDEIGMEQADIPPDRIRDPVELNVPGHALGRDGCRTPMQWDDSPHAGFSTSEPWLPLSEEHGGRNLAAQLKDEGSLYHFYRRLIALRRSQPILTAGTLKNVRCTEQVLIFEREHGEEIILVALNLHSQRVQVEFPGGHFRAVLSTRDDGSDQTFVDRVKAEPFEGIVLIKL
jgi:glycosidase